MEMEDRFNIRLINEQGDVFDNLFTDSVDEIARKWAKGRQGSYTAEIFELAENKHPATYEPTGEIWTYRNA